MLIGPIIDTVDSVDFHIHTVPVTVYTNYTKYNQFRGNIPVSSVRNFQSYGLPEGYDSLILRKSFFLPRPGNYPTFQILSSIPMRTGTRRSFLIA